MPPPRTLSPPVAPRPAATTLILRDGDTGLEVLMVKRSATASFMPGAYVFPGGAVDARDGDPDHVGRCDETVQSLEQRIGQVTGVGAQAAAFAVAALRECFEECGLWIGATPPDAAGLRARLHAGEPLAALAAGAGLPLATSVLQPWAHWITPLGVPKRFDTLFFVLRAPADQQPSVDEGETTTLTWVNPAEALRAKARGEIPMEFATASVVRTLEPYSAGPVQALLDDAAAVTRLPVVEPRLRVDEQGHVVGVVLPGQPGYDAAHH